MAELLDEKCIYNIKLGLPSIYGGFFFSYSYRLLLINQYRSRHEMFVSKFYFRSPHRILLCVR